MRLIEAEAASRRDPCPPFRPRCRSTALISAGPLRSLAGQQDNPFAGETLAIAEDLLPPGGDVYALKVDGESMIDAFVCDGDWVIIKHQTTAQPRDMIVAWVADREETTLKYYFPGRAPRCGCSRPTRPISRSVCRPINWRSRAKSWRSFASFPKGTRVTAPLLPVRPRRIIRGVFLYSAPCSLYAILAPQGVLAQPSSNRPVQRRRIRRTMWRFLRTQQQRGDQVDDGGEQQPDRHDKQQRPLSDLRGG